MDGKPKSMECLLNPHRFLCVGWFPGDVPYHNTLMCISRDIGHITVLHNGTGVSSFNEKENTNPLTKYLDTKGNRLVARWTSRMSHGAHLELHSSLTQMIIYSLKCWLLAIVERQKKFHVNCVKYVIFVSTLYFSYFNEMLFRILLKNQINCLQYYFPTKYNILDIHRGASSRRMTMTLGLWLW